MISSREETIEERGCGERQIANWVGAAHAEIRPSPTWICKRCYAVLLCQQLAGVDAPMGVSTSVPARLLGVLVPALVVFPDSSDVRLRTRNWSMRIPEARNLELLELSKRSVRNFFKHEMTTYAAALAYRALFVTFPFLAVLIALLGFLEIGSFFEWLTNQTSYALQKQYAGFAQQAINQGLHQAQGGLLTSVSLVAFWSVSGGVRLLTKALNAVHEVRESRPGWKRIVLQLLFALGLAPTVILAVALLLIGPRVIEAVVGLVGLDEVFISLWAWLRLPVALILLMLAVSIVYWVVPNATHPYRLITPGAALAVIVWIVASLGFSFYVSHFADYSVVYGGLATAIVLLLYFYISAIVLLMGAEVNVALYDRASDRKIREEERGKDHEASETEKSDAQ